MSGAGRDGFFLGGVGSDIFGETYTARVLIQDHVNDFLLRKYMREYCDWQRENHRFHDNFESDRFKDKLNWYKKWGYTFGGIAFAAIVINPNFTRRRAWYARKAIPLLTGVIAYQYGYANENKH